MVASLILYFSLLLIVLGLGIAVTRSHTAVKISLSMSFAVALLAWLVWNRPYFLTYIFPNAGAVFFANLFPLAVAIAAPATVRLGKSKAEKVRFSLLMFVLLLASLTGTLSLFGTPAQVAPTEYFPDGTCRQTSIDTCSAAACVTFMKQHGIVTTEAEMASLALSKEGRGTHPLGVYRALKLKLKTTTSTLNVKYAAVNVDELFSMNRPAIVNAGLLHQPRNKLENDLTEKYQWEPGVVHSVVFLAEDGKKVDIADPDFGIEAWHVDGFATLYNGTAIWIE